jgi:methylenetetrahydrofolate dehydrogenase (NADP+)/methenyltetrahydrofolate cyclohydrolase
MLESKIIDGKKIAIIFLEQLHSKILQMRLDRNIIPKLCIVQLGNNDASNLYIQNKIARARSLDMEALYVKFESDIAEAELVENIKTLNKDETIHGIIVQLPLPNHINVDNIAETIDPKKDVDGFHPINLGYLIRGEDKGFIPCTPLGCLHLLNYYLKTIESKNIAVIGRSNIVGRPLACLLTNNNATVTLCHSYTKNIKDITISADIVISAVGVANLFDSSHFKEGVVIVDVGINRIGNKFTGDINFDDVAPKAKLITPVPGGVGPMTVAYLMSNLYKAALNS